MNIKQLKELAKNQLKDFNEGNLFLERTTGELINSNRLNVTMILIH